MLLTPTLIRYTAEEVGEGYRVTVDADEPAREVTSITEHTGGFAGMGLTLHFEDGTSEDLDLFDTVLVEVAD